MSRTLRRGPVLGAAVLLGAGLGGFVDGILFHQILQWHNMLSSLISTTDFVGVKVNMVWDGFFHAFTWLMTAAGIALLWRAGLRSDVAWSTRTFVGGLLLGWGLFNVVEGVIDHQILEIHHVHPGPGWLLWDLGFLGLGVVLVLGGWALAYSGRRETARRGAAHPVTAYPVPG